MASDFPEKVQVARFDTSEVSSPLYLPANPEQARLNGAEVQPYFSASLVEEQVGKLREKAAACRDASARCKTVKAAAEYFGEARAYDAIADELEVLAQSSLGVEG